MTITQTIDLGSLENPSWRDLRDFVDTILRKEAANEHRIQVRIEGSKLSATVERELTVAEEAKEWQRRFETLGGRILAALPPNDSVPLSARERHEMMQRIYGIVGEPPKPTTGSGIAGTQGPAAPAFDPSKPPKEASSEPTDEQNKARWRKIAVEVGGWDLSRDEELATALRYARRMGWPELKAADVERWEGRPSGTLAAV